MTAKRKLQNLLAAGDEVEMSDDQEVPFLKKKKKYKETYEEMGKMDMIKAMKDMATENGRHGLCKWSRPLTIK